MNIYVLILIALGLSFDAFAVSVGGSVYIDKITARHIFRIAFHFGLFQALMPIVGWFAGKGAHTFIAAWDHWVAFLLLTFIGGRIIYDTLSSSEEKKWNKDPSRGMALVMLSIATSIDALAVGLSLAMLEVSIWYPAAIIGVVTLVVCVLGMLIGDIISKRLQKGMKLSGGSDSAAYRPGDSDKGFVFLIKETPVNKQPGFLFPSFLLPI